MEIVSIGHSSFKLKTKTASLITDPYDPKIVGLAFPSVSADIVTVSHPHEDHNRSGLVKDSQMVIDGPGEYEVKGISVIGISSFHDDKKGKERGKNVIYVIEAENLRICHMGDLGHRLSEKIIENIGDIDILMIPVGGVYTIDSKTAAEVVRDIEPSIVIPMHFFEKQKDDKTFGKLEKVESFLSELGVSVEKVSKLKVTKADTVEDRKVVLFEKK